ncbi:MAG: glycosyltransferase family 2 protein [Anaerolineales bacterium]|nr:glycosyltransferase family 2 protein [Anaerolineales bacterium]
MTRISVIIPTYNRVHLLDECVKSVLEQTYHDYEIIVVDDGSTDSTREIVGQFFGPIRYVYQEHRGVSAARNHGIQLAQGDYITFLDSDDLYLPTKLEKQVRFLDDNPNCGVVYCSYTLFDEINTLSRRYPATLSGKVYRQFLSQCMLAPVALPTVALRREVLTTCGIFDEKMSSGEDIDLWCRIARHYEFGTIQESLCKIRRHSTNTDNRNNLELCLYLIDKAFRADLDLGWFFKRRVYGNIYGFYSHNTLFCEKKPLKALRQLFIGLSLWPFQPITIRAYLMRSGFLLVNALPRALTSRVMYWRHWESTDSL